MKTTICYKMKNGKRYLAYYTFKTLEEAVREADRLNNSKPEKLWNGRAINWELVDYFFASRQEAM